jgi:hypothetical protein
LALQGPSFESLEIVQLARLFNNVSVALETQGLLLPKQFLDIVRKKRTGLLIFQHRVVFRLTSLKLYVICPAQFNGPPFKLNVALIRFILQVNVLGGLL